TSRGTSASSASLPCLRSNSRSWSSWMVSTDGSHPKPGRYLRNLTTRIEWPTDWKGGKARAITSTFFIVPSSCSIAQFPGRGRPPCKAVLVPVMPSERNRRSALGTPLQATLHTSASLQRPWIDSCLPCRKRWKIGERRPTWARCRGAPCWIAVDEHAKPSLDIQYGEHLSG